MYHDYLDCHDLNYFDDADLELLTGADCDYCDDSKPEFIPNDDNTCDACGAGRN
mgnify:CR=1 FL=1